MRAGVAARHPAPRTPRSANPISLHLRRNLPCPRRRGGPCSAPVQYTDHAMASGRDRHSSDARRARGRPPRSGRLAHLPQAQGPPTHHTDAAAAPDLNPVEVIWQFIRDNGLSNRTFKSYADIVDHCCFAWNSLIDRPWKIMTIGSRTWSKTRPLLQLGI